MGSEQDMTMEEMLTAYRKKKAAECLLSTNATKKTSKHTVSTEDSDSDERGEVPDRQELLLGNTDIDACSLTSDDGCPSYTKKDLFWLIFKLSLWSSVYYIAIKAEFGFVFLGFSLLFFIYFNTRTGKKKKGEVSAYSVFNKDCKPIEGSIQAEDLQRQMLGGLMYHQCKYLKNLCLAWCFFIVKIFQEN